MGEASSTTTRKSGADILAGMRTHLPLADAPKQDGEPCDNCNGPMMGHACKLICANCGFRRDCSDA